MDGTGQIAGLSPMAIAMMGDCRVLYPIGLRIKGDRFYAAASAETFAAILRDRDQRRARACRPSGNGAGPAARGRATASGGAAVATGAAARPRPTRETTGTDCALSRRSGGPDLDGLDLPRWKSSRPHAG